MGNELRAKGVESDGSKVIYKKNFEAVVDNIIRYVGGSK